MLGTVERKWNILLGKILNLYNFGCGMAVIPAYRNNHSITDPDVILVGNVIIAFVAFVKFHAAINIVVSATLDIPIDRRVEYFTASVELNEIPYIIGKIAPKLRQSLLIICFLDDTLWTLFEIHRDGIIL